MAIGYSKEIQHLLYDDEDGNLVGLDEAQLIDPAPQARVVAVRALLAKDDLYLVFQASILLAAWGDPSGLREIEKLIDIRVDDLIEIAPHRIHDYDNVYDELAYAVHLYGLSSDDMLEERQRIFQKLLQLYGVKYFESKLKHALLKSSFSSLAPDVQAAIDRSMALERRYLASQLLPVLARWQPLIALKMIETFMGLPPASPDPKINVAEALKYIPTSERLELLEELARNNNPLIAEEARRSSTAAASASPG